MKMSKRDNRDEQEREQERGNKLRMSERENI